MVGGGSGTLTEASAAYMKGKPIVTLLGSGGIADEIAGRYLDDRKIVKVLGVKKPEQAVKKALSELELRRS